MSSEQRETSPRNRRIAVVGAGAVGCFIGGLLSLHGEDVWLVGRPGILDPMDKRGVILRAPDGSEQIARPSMTTDVASLDGKFDLILLTVKAYAITDAIATVSDLIAPEGVVVSFQNGVGSDRLLLERFAASRVIAATSTVSVGIDQPGTVQQYTENGGLAFSEYDAKARSRSVGTVLRATALTTIHVLSPQSLKWSKLLLNAIGSAQCAILQADVSSIVADARLFHVEQLAFRETLAAMQRAQIAVVDLPGYPVQQASFFFGLPTKLARLTLGRRIAQGRGGKRPALYADVVRGGPSEIEFLNGATVALGAKLKLATPINSSLTQMVKEVTESSEARDKFRERPEELLKRLGLRP